jgi:hypothetical protein
MFTFSEQNAEHNHDIKTTNKSFENVANMKYLDITLTDQNCIHEEINSRRNSGNACYHLVQNLLCSCYLRIQSLIHTELQFCLLFCMGGKLGLSN